MTIDCEFHGEQPTIEESVWRGSSGERIVLRKCAVCAQEEAEELDAFLNPRRQRPQ